MDRAKLQEKTMVGDTETKSIICKHQMEIMQWRHSVGTYKCQLEKYKEKEEQCSRKIDDYLQSLKEARDRIEALETDKMLRMAQTTDVERLNHYIATQDKENRELMQALKSLRKHEKQKHLYWKQKAKSLMEQVQVLNKDVDNGKREKVIDMETIRQYENKISNLTSSVTEMKSQLEILEKKDKKKNGFIKKYESEINDLKLAYEHQEIQFKDILSCDEKKTTSLKKQLAYIERKCEKETNEREKTEKKLKLLANELTDERKWYIPK